MSSETDRELVRLPPGSTLMGARLRLALDASDMGLWDWDIVSGVLVWDERSAAMYGTTIRESTGSIADVDARVHPEDLAHVREALAGAIDQAGVVDVEFRVVWPDGSAHWLYGRGQAIVDETGATIRLIGVNLDVTAVRQEAEERSADAQRMAGLVGVAQALGDSSSELEVLEVVTGLGAAALGAQGVVLVLASPEGSDVRALTTSFFDDQVRADVAVLPADFPLPMVHACVTGTPHFYENRAAAVARFPGSEALYVRARTEGSAAVPLRAGGELFGSLSVAFDAPHAWRPSDRELLEAFGSLTAQTLDRVRARNAEIQAARATRQLSETLQRSLLTAPPDPKHLHIAVRYRPAVQQAQIGGDWYDAFLTPDGGTTLVIGDVAGHDLDAAAAMGQARNILRGVAQSIDASPAGVLSAFDRALRGLQLDTLASAVLCQISPRFGTGGAGECALRWSNAGHPPPLLLHPDGRGELLDREPNLLLGLQPDSLRTDHELVLRPGASLLLYTDGLVERRGEGLDDGLERLREAVTLLHGLSPELLCDALLDQFAVDPEDDVALLVVRVRAEEVPHGAPV